MRRLGHRSPNTGTTSIPGPCRRLAGAAAAGVVVLALAGCGGGSASTGAQTSWSTASTGAASSSAATALTVTDPWVKATDSKMPGMTGMFATLSNPGDTPVTITGGASPVAGMVELHETVMSGGVGTMQQKEGGFELPPGGTLTLKPGGDHVMLMHLNGELAPGSTVKVTLSTSNGELEIDAPVRTFAGGNENYAGTAT